MKLNIGHKSIHIFKHYSESKLNELSKNYIKTDESLEKFQANSKNF